MNKLTKRIVSAIFAITLTAGVVVPIVVLVLKFFFS